MGKFDRFAYNYGHMLTWTVYVRTLYCCQLQGLLPGFFYSGNLTAGTDDPLLMSCGYVCTVASPFESANIKLSFEMS